MRANNSYSTVAYFDDLVNLPRLLNINLHKTCVVCKYFNYKTQLKYWCNLLSSIFILLTEVLFNTYYTLLLNMNVYIYEFIGAIAEENCPYLLTCNLSHVYHFKTSPVKRINILLWVTEPPWNLRRWAIIHYDDVIMDSIASQITSLTIVYSIVHSGTDQRKHQSSASLAFVWGIHRGPVNSPHNGPVTRKMFPFDDVIMLPISLS